MAIILLIITIPLFVCQIYEERAYVATKWVVTQVTGKPYKESSSEGFMRLFKYIAGTNKEGKVCISYEVSTSISRCYAEMPSTRPDSWRNLLLLKRLPGTPAFRQQ